MSMCCVFVFVWECAVLHLSVIVGLNTVQTKEDSFPGMWAFLRKLLIQVSMGVDSVFADVGLWSIRVYLWGSRVNCNKPFSALSEEKAFFSKWWNWAFKIFFISNGNHLIIRKIIRQTHNWTVTLNLVKHCSVCQSWTIIEQLLIFDPVTSDLLDLFLWLCVVGEV